jgi:hypothetical protein
MHHPSQIGRSQVPREPSLNDLLSEPIIMMMMARDGVTEDDIRILVSRVKEGRRTIGDSWQAA